MKNRYLLSIIKLFPYSFKNILVIFLSFSILIVSCRSNKKEIAPFSSKLVWFNSIEEAYKVAKKNKGIILLEFKADWCAPCKILEKQLFIKEDFKLFVEKNKITLVSIDLTFDDTENAKFGDLYKIEGLPTLIILDHNKKEKGRVEGFTTLPEFMEELKAVINK